MLLAVVTQFVLKTFSFLTSEGTQGNCNMQDVNDSTLVARINMRLTEGPCILKLHPIFDYYVEGIEAMPGAGKREINILKKDKDLPYKERIEFGEPFYVQKDVDEGVSFEGVSSAIIWIGRIVNVKVGRKIPQLVFEEKVEFKDGEQLLTLPTLLLPFSDFRWIYVKRKSNCSSQLSDDNYVYSRGEKYADGFYAYDFGLSSGMFRPPQDFPPLVFRDNHFPIEHLVFPDECFDVTFDTYNVVPSIPFFPSLSPPGASIYYLKKSQLDKMNGSQIIVRRMEEEAKRVAAFSALHEYTLKWEKCLSVEGVSIQSRLYPSELPMNPSFKSSFPLKDERFVKVKVIGKCMGIYIQEGTSDTNFSHIHRSLLSEDIEKTIGNLLDFGQKWDNWDFDKINIGVEYRQNSIDRDDFYHLLLTSTVCCLLLCSLSLLFFYFLVIYSSTDNYDVRLWCYCNCRGLYDTVLHKFDPIDTGKQPVKEQLVPKGAESLLDIFGPPTEDTQNAVTPQPTQEGNSHGKTDEIADKVGSQLQTIDQLNTKSQRISNKTTVDEKTREGKGEKTREMKGIERTREAKGDATKEITREGKDETKEITKEGKTTEQQSVLSNLPVQA